MWKSEHVAAAVVILLIDMSLTQIAATLVVADVVARTHKWSRSTPLILAQRSAPCQRGREHATKTAG
jgi:hypothetical protein